MKKASMLLVFVLALTGFSCQKDTNDQVKAHVVEIWTLKNYSLNGQECVIDPARLEENEKLVADEEILTYYASDHYFTLTAAAINRLKDIKSKTPFYLKVDNKVVYTGLLMPSYLSLACPGIIIDPISYSNNSIQVRLQYLTSQPINDQRNNAILLKALEEQGKLRK